MQLPSLDMRGGYQWATVRGYMLLFCARYVDLFWNRLSPYNTAVKIIYITLSTAIVLASYCVPSLRNTYDRKADMRLCTVALVLVLPAVGLGCTINMDAIDGATSSPFEMAW